MDDYQPEGINEAPADEQLERLRHLILRKEQEQIEEIRTRLDDTGVRSREIGELLPAAVRHSDGTGPGLEIALASSFEKVTQRSIRRDPKAFADALYPVMGPSIRKAIAEALKDLVRSLNLALDYSLSWKGLKWRIEALRTGRSFSEIVLLKTLVFRVEQVFLIQRESGIALVHLAAPEAEVNDADMVSGMLTAIQDFVRDGFHMEGEESLQTMEVGNLNVWVDQGPHAVLAAVIRGIAPTSYRQKLSEVNEAVHLEMQKELADFKGDGSAFERIRPTLETCLESQDVNQDQRTSPRVWIVGALLLGVLGWWLVTHWRNDRAVGAYVHSLKDTAGIVVTEVERIDGETVVRGLRDPLATDPQVILEGMGLNNSHLRSSFQPFTSLDEALVLKRARKVLRPPSTVTLTMADGVLSASGLADPQWVNRSRQVAVVLPGVDDYRDDNIEIKDPALSEMSRLKRRIEEQAVAFDVNSTDIGRRQAPILAETIRDITRILELGTASNLKVSILIESHSDSTGSRAVNQTLGRARADAVMNFLVEGGIPPQVLNQVDRDTATPPHSGLRTGEEDQRNGRTVSLAVEILSDNGIGEPLE
jgi:OOP family OmpA-OmpF porin